MIKNEEGMFHVNGASLRLFFICLVECLDIMTICRLFVHKSKPGYSISDN